MDTHETAPAAIERQLVQEILGGRYPVGSRLPTLRELAQRFDVSPSTLQRVMTRLEARGLITARQGSGFKVNDPRETGDISLLPSLVEANLGKPDLVRRLLSDFFALRRTLTIQLFVRSRERLQEMAPCLFDGFEPPPAAEAGGDAEARCRADLSQANAFVQLSGNWAIQLLLNTAARLFEALPELREAYYGDPESLGRMVLPLQRIFAGDFHALQEIEEDMAEHDRAAIERFVTMIGAREATSGDAPERTGADPRGARTPGA